MDTSQINEAVAAACDALDKLSDLVANTTISAPNADMVKAINDQQPLSQACGPSHPAMSRDDLAKIPAQLSKKLREADTLKIDGELEKELFALPVKLATLHGNKTVVKMFDGGGSQAIAAYLLTMQWVDHITNQIFDWNYIVNAHHASVKEEKEMISNYIEDIIKAKEKAYKNLDLSDDYTASIEINKKETDKLVEKCGEAYQITTTKGLAASFEQRAKELKGSIIFWILGLISALSLGSVIGYYRVSMLDDLLKLGSNEPLVIGFHVSLSLLSFGAPLWFAWLATKQIGQRFRLAEDYAYKASVAKAYEGYRKEASRIDPTLEARLFSTALTRVEEAPLRLVNYDIYGSPWQELVSSEAFQNAIKNIPELRDKFIELARDGVKSVRLVAAKKSVKSPTVEQDKD